MKKNREFNVSKAFFTSTLILVLVLLFIVVKTVFLPESIEKTLAFTSTTGRDEVHANETVNLPDLSAANNAEIVERNPLGISSQTEGTNKRTSFEPVISDELELALLGTVTGSPEMSRAIIMNLRTGISNVYEIGQTVEGALIENIEPEKVTLLYNGKIKILRLSTVQFSSKNKSTEIPLFGTTNEISNAPKANSSNRKPQTITECVEVILNKAVIEPHVIDGQVEGLRITDLENIEEAKYLGLQNGDIICTVNGHTLTNKQKAHQIFKKASSQAAISLEILRDNETKKLSFDLR